MEKKRRSLLRKAEKEGAGMRKLGSDRFPRHDSQGAIFRCLRHPSKPFRAASAAEHHGLAILNSLFITSNKHTLGVKVPELLCGAF